jgi:hypothetical protein
MALHINKLKNKIYIGIEVLALVLAMCIFSYMDGHSLLCWSFEFWDALFSGRIAELHTVLVENVRGATHVSCGGNFIWILPLAVWNFPLWLLNELCIEYVVLPAWMTIWTKILYLVMIFCMGKAIKEILQTENGKWTALVLLLGSPEILISSMYSGQEEIIYVALFIIGLKYYTQGKNKYFWICTILSAIMCPIMLMPLMILILDYKKPLKVIMGAVAALVPSFLYGRLYGGDEWYSYYQLPFVVWIKEMLNRPNLESPFGPVPIFVIMVFLLLWKAFTINQEENEINKRLQLCALSMIALSFFTEQSFYRFFLYVPFLIIFILANHETNDTNVIAFVILNLCRLYVVLKQPYVLETASSMPWVKKSANVQLITFLSNRIESLAQIEYIVNGVLYASLFLLIYNVFVSKNEVRLVKLRETAIIGYSLINVVVIALFCCMVI